MTLRITVAAGLLLAAQAPAFDVASVTLNKDIRPRVSMTVSPGGILYIAASLTDCLQAAYGVKRYQIAGPDWLSSQRYNISARTAVAASEEQIKSMLQMLIADRFKVSLHRERKEMSVFLLLVGRNGAKLKAGDPTGHRSMTGGPGALVFTNTSMEDLAQFLTGLPSMGRPVFDSTRLEGRFDFTIQLNAPPNAAPEEAKRAAVDSDPSPFLDALDLLGLRLDRQRASIDMLVIDDAAKIPTAD